MGLLAQVWEGIVTLLFSNCNYRYSDLCCSVATALSLATSFVL